MSEPVAPWNQYHMGQTYTPEQLREIAAKNPDHATALEWLAREGGAVLS